MNWADFVVLGIVFLSALISLLRGFIKEALSLLTWVVAIWVALMFFDEFAVLFENWIDLPSARLAVAFVILFVVVLILGAVVNYLAGQLVKKTGMSGTDRMLGVLFGVVRGVFIVGLLVVLAGLTPLPKDPWWRESVFMGHFQEFAIWLRDRLPDNVAEHIDYGESENGDV